MTFAAPGLLFGLLGALIPLVLHLLFRRKPRIQVLPTLRFIRIANQKVLKRHRLRRRLLLLARMLLVGLAALAMSRPFLVTQSANLDAQIEGDAVVVIDNSYFTLAETEDGTLLDTARRIATTLVEQAPRRVSVLMTCTERPSVLPLSADKKAAYSFLESAQSMRKLGSIRDSVTRANQLLTESVSEEIQGTIFVISSSPQLAQLNPSNSESAVRTVPINLTAGLSVDNAAIVGMTAGRAPELGENYWEVSVEIT
ncbi:MAG: BatA domain-containing protein, partial [Bradymonadia bacterium]